MIPLRLLLVSGRKQEKPNNTKRVYCNQSNEALKGKPKGYEKHTTPIEYKRPIIYPPKYNHPNDAGFYKNDYKKNKKGKGKSAHVKH